MTNYVVLRREEAADRWEEIGVVSAGSSRTAITKAVKANGKTFGTGELVAVPLRSWNSRLFTSDRFRYSQESLLELYRAARGAERKLRDEYHRFDPEAPELESWAEGERLSEALHQMDEQLLTNVLDGKGFS